MLIEHSVRQWRDQPDNVVKLNGRNLGWLTWKGQSKKGHNFIQNIEHCGLITLVVVVVVVVVVVIASIIVIIVGNVNVVNIVVSVDVTVVGVKSELFLYLLML